MYDFYPRPPGGGRPYDQLVETAKHAISIHALRVEGDLADMILAEVLKEFLSTPSGWRATHLVGFGAPCHGISIHALRVEGDLVETAKHAEAVAISIHALRVEGDSKNGQSFRLFLRKREKNLPL